MHQEIPPQARKQDTQNHAASRNPVEDQTLMKLQFDGKGHMELSRGGSQESGQDYKKMNDARECIRGCTRKYHPKQVGQYTSPM